MRNILRAEKQLNSKSCVYASAQYIFDSFRHNELKSMFCKYSVNKGRIRQLCLIKREKDFHVPIN